MKRPSIFVVDDEPQICALLTRILQREGYGVQAFESGPGALAALASDPPDLVVTDLMMPGMSGLELVRRARAALPGVGAVLTTGYASFDNVVEALRSGVDDFVTKPFSVAEIRGVVSRVLASGHAGTSAVRPAATQPDTAEIADAALSRRFRDMSLMESVHGLLAEEPSSAELLPRCEATIDGALGHGRALLLAPTGHGAAFRVVSATDVRGPWTAEQEFESGALSLIVASGVPAAISRDALGAAADLLDDGPAAAAPLLRRDPTREDSGTLVVSRPAKARPFDSEDLRTLGVLAGALGDVFRALRTSERAEDAYVATLREVVEATETRIPGFEHHGERVRDLSIALGRRLGLAPADVEALDTASRLLDLGRIETPDDLLRKVARPSADEWRVLRSQPARAEQMVRPLPRLVRVKPIIRHHHENWDGTGYPDGLQRDEIPYLAALVRITDSYAALTSPRAWRGAVDGPTAVRKIVELSGRHFHPQLVAAFAEMLLASDAPADSPVRRPA